MGLKGHKDSREPLENTHLNRREKVQRTEPLGNIPYCYSIWCLLQAQGLSDSLKAQWMGEKSELHVSLMEPMLSLYWTPIHEQIFNLSQILLVNQSNWFTKPKNMIMNCSRGNNSATYWTKNRFIRKPNKETDKCSQHGAFKECD